MLPQDCKVSLNNTDIEGTRSTAVLVQQDRYFDLVAPCIFAGELAYMIIDMRDEFGNVVPIDDELAYKDKYHIEFADGTDFTNHYIQNCEQYRDVVSHEIICKIRPHVAGLQELDAYDL